MNKNLRYDVDEEADEMDDWRNHRSRNDRKRDHDTPSRPERIKSRDRQRRGQEEHDYY